MSQVPPGSSPGSFTPWPTSVQPPAAPAGSFGSGLDHPPPVAPPPVRRDTPDPGSPRRALIFSVVAFVLIGVVMLMQQFGESATTAAVTADKTKIVAPDVSNQTRLASSMMVRMIEFLNGMASSEAEKAQAQSQMKQFVGQIDSTAVTPVDRFRAAIAAAEIDGIETASTKLDTLAASAGQDGEPFPGFAADRATLERIYAGEADQLSSEDRDAFIERHGYFAELALSFGKPLTDPLREKVAGNGGRLIGALVIFGLVLLFAVIAGITCFIIACIKLGQGAWRPAFLPPMPGGSVFIELVAMLAAGFLLMKLAAGVYAMFIKDPQHLITAVLLTQWSLVAVCFYPLLRGVSFAEMRRRIGWTSGKGVVREIGAGIFGYLAFLPVFFLSVVIALLLLMLWSLITSGSADPAAPENPIADLISGTSGFTLLLLFSLATIWAPLVEETVFRGALFRHLRSRLGLFAAGGISAVCFGVMHGYPFILLLPVTMLGFGFAIMREWRGSLIAPIVAHFLHNATILTFAITFFGAVA